MSRYRNRTLGWVFATRMTGIICFLIAIVLANILTFYIANPVYRSGVTLINENFWLLLLIAIIYLTGAVFGAFPFPLNLPAPIIRAFGTVFSIAFLLKVFLWIDGLASTNLYQIFWYLSFLIVPLVFLIVLASGYYDIMRQLWWRPKPDIDVGESPEIRRETPSREGEVSDAKSWEDIGLEFRRMLYDIIHRFRQEIRKS